MISADVLANFRKRLYRFANFEQRRRASYTSENFSLDNQIRLLKALGNPHLKFKSIHVAGTKGKGSVVRLVSLFVLNRMQRHGFPFKVGAYYSPHILEERERFEIDGKVCEWEKIISVFEEVMGIVEDQKWSVTVFDVFTAMAFLLFCREKVDLAIVETGLGGRLDSTNVLRPEVSVVTRIDYDHMEKLGKSLQEIAAEKAGIVKEGVPLVYLKSHDAVCEVMVKTAKEKSARAVGIDPIGVDPIEVVAMSVAADPVAAIEIPTSAIPISAIDIGTQQADTTDVGTNPAGTGTNQAGMGMGAQPADERHFEGFPLWMGENIALAKAVANEFFSNFKKQLKSSKSSKEKFDHSKDFPQNIFRPIEKREVDEVSGRFHYPGRYQFSNRMIFDGAHVPNSLKLLVATIKKDARLQSISQNGVVVAFFSFFDKDVEGLVREIPKEWDFVFVRLSFPFLKEEVVDETLLRAKKTREELGANFSSVDGVEGLVASCLLENRLYVFTGGFRLIAAVQQFLQEKKVSILEKT